MGIQFDYSVNYNERGRQRERKRQIQGAEVALWGCQLTNHSDNMIRDS